MQNYSDLQFYMGESCDPEAMIILVVDKGDSILLYYWKDGLEEEKV